MTCETFNSSGIGVMWKTVSEDCNLACDYCYYSTCAGKPDGVRRIDESLLETFIEAYMRASQGTASFAWQGGEPLLAGLPFFEKVVELQARYAPRGTMISNALQTNGTLITERWADFLKRYNFLVGVSLDGPAALHDQRRVDASGMGSHDRVMRGIRLLEKHQVDFNILTVVHKHNVRHARELIDYFRAEGFHYLQFIPCMDFRSQQVNQPGRYEITPAEYGDFLCEVFDLWYEQGKPRTSIRFFDNLLQAYLNLEAELCVHRSSCPASLVLEQNGDAYPCDFYLHPDWKLGNVGVNALPELLQHPNYTKFQQMKPALPDACHRCSWRKLCHGGCPRNRDWTAGDDAASRDYFCESYRQVYTYAHDRMLRLAASVRRSWFEDNVRRLLGGRLPDRNEPCACGSGRKYKKCCLNTENSVN